MKKIISSLAVFGILALTASAQDDQRLFKRFKGDVSFGVGLPSEPGAYAGFIFAMEPKIALMDKLYFGLRIEGNAVARFSDYSNVNGSQEVEKLIGSYLATADYYLTTNYSFRPFIGGGVGVFALLYDNILYNEVDLQTKFGGVMRIGAEVKHFRLGIEYNMLSSSDVDTYLYDDNGNYVLTRRNAKNAYFGIKAGFVFGGGPR